ncbi:hypothetical protein [Paenibacillus sp. Y412MC10]|uniref:hypothetical protein n=1 Tax=Geobacillus sp. (strain Y412MC10) TaxID=481743 RepID=UPI0011AB762C|nr:hypothetical protein [Paenibacillus sp. Y412MC10]
MLWNHGTTERRKQNIIRRAFRSQSGLWGKGIYLTSSREAAYLFGQSLLMVKVDDSAVSHIYFEEFKKEFPDERSWAKAVSDKGYKALRISYASGENELCVYDPDIIEAIHY